MASDRNSIIYGDALDLLACIPKGTVDAVIMDPPYSSGGLHLAQRVQSTGCKYGRSNGIGLAAMANFSGDVMDGWAYGKWLYTVFTLCRQAVRDKGLLCTFIDWRNLHIVIEALQMAGWVHRGVFVWHKLAARPQKGSFRQEAEFVVWASNGDWPREGACYPGIWEGAPVPGARRLHQTEKPLGLMETLCGIVPEGQLILDPFCGSGTTCLAAKNTGHDFLGFECSDVYFEVAKKRVLDL